MQRLDALTLGAALPLWDEAALRQRERVACTELPPDTLMRRAGAAVAALARARFAAARRIGILCGPGNNGGDGLEAAACLAKAGCAVDVVLVGCGSSAPWSARGTGWHAALQRALDAGVQPRRWDGALPAGCDLLLDALLGIGLREAPRGALADALRALRARVVPLLAVDLPSGLHADSGATPGECAGADVTLSLLGLKPGLFGASAACGELWVDDLGVDDCGARPAARLVAATDALRALGDPAAAAHKGQRGDVRVFGGADGMGGALLLAARAALALGAGRVYAASLDPAAPLLDTHAPELMLRRPDALLAQLGAARADSPQCTVFGPGSGTSKDALALLDALVAIDRPLVLDADALNLLAAQPRDGSLWAALRARRVPAWLTPHPQEAARLLRCDAGAVQADRLRAARALAAHGVVCVLKGAGSVIATPDGACAVNPSGNGLLATAGSGDVLAGALGALLARAETPLAAGQAAVWLHGAAADLARPRRPTLRAGELGDWMLRAWHVLRRARGAPSRAG